MPPSSRKRNKGKDRKAKQLAKKEKSERADARNFWLRFCGSTQCNHGHALGISMDHPATFFIDTFYIDLLFKKIPMDQVIRSTFVTHPHVWNNESPRKSVIDILVRVGTNMLWYEDEKHVDTSRPVCIAQAIVVLEHYNDTDDIESVMDKRMVRSKWRDLWLGGNSCRRDALKFFRKRTCCKCLKKIHLEARKTMPKIGKCYHCKEEKDRVSLSVCSRCMVMHYCSRECQVADWPVHEEDCDDCVRAHKQQTAICQDK